MTNCDFAPKLLSVLKGKLLLSAPEQPLLDNGGLVAFGERLRRERLGQGVELEALAKQLCMRTEQIEALENANLQQWPENAFAVAQVRRLAGALNLDADQLVSELRPLLEQAAAQLPSLAAIAVMGASSKRRENMPSREEGTKDWLTASTTKPASSSKPQGLFWLLAIALVAGLGSITFKQLSNQQQPSAKPLNQSISTPTPAAPKPQNKKSNITNLRINAKQNAWLSVRQLDDKKILFQGNFKGNRLFPLGKGLELRAGRPDLVQIQLGDGPSKTLGPIEKVEWLKFMPPATAPKP